MHRDGRVGTPPPKQPSLDQLHKLPRQPHTSGHSKDGARQTGTDSAPEFFTDCVCFLAGSNDSLLPGDDRSRPVVDIAARIVRNLPSL